MKGVYAIQIFNLIMSLDYNYIEWVFPLPVRKKYFHNKLSRVSVGFQCDTLKYLGSESKVCQGSFLIFNNVLLGTVTIEYFMDHIL